MNSAGLSGGRLVVLVGLPGAGKTTIAAWLGHEFGFSVASRDVIRAAMFPHCTFTLEEKAAAYAGMKLAITTMLGLGLDVVTDGIAFSSGIQLQEVVEIGRQASRPVTVLSFAVPLQLAQNRVEADRKIDPSVPADRDAAMVTETAARFDPLPADAIVIDGADSVPGVRRSVAAALGLELLS
jgi:predicted kinase